MKLIVNPDAAKWYKQELSLDAGEYLRFFTQIYGTSNIHPNYSLGIANKPPQSMAISTVVEGITFYFEDSDAWFLEDHNMVVKLNNDEIEFEFTDNA